MPKRKSSHKSSVNSKRKSALKEEIDETRESIIAAEEASVFQNNNNDNREEKETKQVEKNKSQGDSSKIEGQKVSRQTEKSCAVVVENVIADVSLPRDQDCDDKFPFPEKNEETETGETAENNERDGENQEQLVEVLLTDLDASDSQICNAEEHAQKERVLESMEKSFELSSDTNTIKLLIDDIGSINRIILDAKRNLASFKLKVLQSQRHKQSHRSKP